jgi:hypothetical protein
VRFPTQIKPIAYMEAIALPRRWDDFGDAAAIFRALRSDAGERMIRQTPTEVAEAAMTLVVSSAAQDVARGLFVKIRRLKRASSAGTATASEQRKRLWELSEGLVARTMATHACGRKSA